VTAPPSLLQPVAKAHQFLTFTTPPNLQAAVAYGLAKDASYFEALAGGLQAKRDRLAAGLRGVGFDVLPAAATYFVVADISSFTARCGFEGDDQAFCRWLTAEAGVTAIPVSAFFVQDAPASCIRFCFSKKDEVLDEAIARLRRRFAVG
jgi:aspartate/methionine/tyrosine aminotransferase